MDKREINAKAIFDDLVSLEESSFPKKCETCLAVYNSVEDYTTKTQMVSGRSGLKSSEDDEGESIIELFRNCVCGSTLLDFFADRRDLSSQGEKRRKAFNKVLNHLIDEGINQEDARTELKYYLKHKKSEMLERLSIFKKRAKHK